MSSCKPAALQQKTPSVWSKYNITSHFNGEYQVIGEEATSTTMFQCDFRASSSSVFRPCGGIFQFTSLFVLRVHDYDVHN